ncbi:class I SAM-dependent methyltransferase [Deltaproteobacteria bacterium OttesenSCG-928-M10]|nr:class I SAM-dependent methyltransferase [Deltaproteobacteria bacterium OttesenSCG-928-M10]
MLRSGILEAIGHKHQTDKSGRTPGGHDYLRKYEFFLRPLRHKQFTLLELGIFKGASLSTWAEYFSGARIVGVDIEPETRVFAGGRVEIIIGDLSRTDFLRSLNDLNAKVIIDDASHWWPDQLRALFVLYPALMSGGIYIVEDIHTSFDPLTPLFSAGLEHRPFQVMQKIAEYMTGNDKPAPIVKDQNLVPIERAGVFEDEIRFMADQTEAVIFIERACLLIKK